MESGRGKMPLHISEEAKQLINSIILSKQISTAYCLRIGIKGGACMGKYFLAFDKVNNSEDLVYRFGKRKAIIAKKELMYLIGKSIEVETDEDGEAGLIFC